MKCSDLNTAKLIARFELNLLSSDEKKQFEEHLLQCDACFQDYYSMSPVLEIMQKEKLALQKALEVSPEEDFIGAKLKGLLQNLVTLITPRLNPAWSLGITLCLALMVALILVPMPQNYRDLAVIEPVEYTPIVLKLRGTEEVMEWETQFKAGMQFYSDTNYVQAIEELARANQANPDNLEIQFYLGLSYLLNENIESAVVHLQRAIESDDSVFVERAHWYLGNAYLLGENGPEAANEFKQVFLLNGAYAEKARALLNTIADKEDEFILLKSLKSLKMQIKSFFD